MNVFEQFRTLPNNLEEQLEFIKLHKEAINETLQKTKHFLTKCQANSQYALLLNEKTKEFLAYEKTLPPPSGYRLAREEDLSLYIISPGKKFLELLDIYHSLEALLLPFYSIFESVDNLTLKKHLPPQELAQKAENFLKSKEERIKFAQRANLVLVIDPMRFEIRCEERKKPPITGLIRIDLPNLRQRHYFLTQCEKIEKILKKAISVKKTELA